MTATNSPAIRSGFLKRLMQDQTGNTLAIAAAAVFPVIGIVGGAVDIGRGYMTKSRLQQACDAGALAARKAMDGAVLLDTEKAVGYRFFDFNFASGTYGTNNLVRTYSQPSTNATPPVPLPQINGSASLEMPTALMRVFGNESLTISVSCTAKQDVSHADVAMVLDVTGSMAGQMKMTTASSPTESRLSALKRATKAFYDTLGPGRAGGDLTKGRIRYAVIPYGRVANVGNLLTTSQMVDSHTYPSRSLMAPQTFNHWSDTTADLNSTWTWTPTASQLNNIKNTANYPAANWSSQTGTGTYTFDNILNDAPTTIDKKITTVGGVAAIAANCYQANLYVAGANDSAPGLFGVGRRSDSISSTNDTSGNVAPVHPATFRVINNRSAKLTTKSLGIRYKWVSNECRLQVANGNTSTNFSKQNVVGMRYRDISWASRTARLFNYQQYLLDVSALKKANGTFNSSLSIPNIDASGGTSLDVRLSGSLATQTSYAGSTPAARTVNWLGCVEERQIDNTITGSTSFTAIPSAAYDLNIKILAAAADDATRWRPFLDELVYTPEAVAFKDMDDSDPVGGVYGTAGGAICPSPAFKLQEVSSYNADPLDIPYFADKLVFDDNASGAAAYYYPYMAPTADNPSTTTVNEANNNNLPTLKNYIDRIRMTPGTIHDPAFVWGMHLVSGQGMFASENPDYFEGMLVGRHIVFMTDGEANPGEDKYTFSGYNMVDGRVAPANTSDAAMKVIHNSRLRILCEEAKKQGITVWVVVIKDGVSSDADLRGCASSASNFKSATNSAELISSFQTIAQSIGGLRITE